MADIRAVSVCVDYGDIAALTVPWNRRHFAEHWIVTTPEDELTREVAARHDCQVYLTREFFYKGAEFAKWRALEMALDAIGRHGWMLLLDADVCWPRQATLPALQMGCLYGANRRMLEDRATLAKLSVTGIPDERAWSEFPIHHNVGEWAGYTQLFHADDPHLPQGHWHETNWRSCGVADSFFQRLWPGSCKIKFPWEVLHIGSAGENWYGRTLPYLDGRPEHPEAQERLRKHKDLKHVRGKSGFSTERIE